MSIEDLDRLAKSSRILLNCVGPYHLYSSPVVETCARNGTHYLDVTGESPWVLEMIEKYHDIARKTGAIIIPEIGIESAPSDMLAWSLATLFKESLSLDTAEVICTLHEVESRPSGGTLATVLGIFDSYNLKDIGRATKPWAMSPIPGPPSWTPLSTFTKLFGVRQVPDLGILTTSIAGPSNRAIVHRTWGLLDRGTYYGPNFQYSEYLSVRNSLIGIIVHFTFILGVMTLYLRPLRWLIRKFVYAPGEGRPKSLTKNEIFEYRAVATADEKVNRPSRAFARLRWNGGIYHLTGVFLAEAAMVILLDSKIFERSNGGGVLTPAVLGPLFIERLQQAGVIFETGLIPQK